MIKQLYVRNSQLIYLVGIVLQHHHHGVYSNSRSCQCHHEYSPQASPQIQCKASHPGGLDQCHDQSKHCNKPQHLLNVIANDRRYQNRNKCIASFPNPAQLPIVCSMVTASNKKLGVGLRRRLEQVYMLYTAQLLTEVCDP